MGSTLIEKIIQHNTGIEKVTPGQIVTVDVDRVMIHDIFIPFAADKFKEMGFTKTDPSFEGRPCFDPASLLKLYFYGYRNSIRSSRKLAKASPASFY